MHSFNLNPSGNAPISSSLGIAGIDERLRSSFVNLAYGYKARYTLSASARRDGSNYFGVATNQKTIPLWSLGAKWDISKEGFYALGLLPSLSLRCSYGYNGNLDRSITGVTTFEYASNARYTNLPYATISNIGNPELRWEQTGIANFAIDFASAANTISGSMDYYFKGARDILGYKTFASNTGISALEGNYSDMAGQGFDLSVSVKNLTGRLSWTTTLLFSHASDKVTRYDINPYAYQLVGADGNQSVAAPVLGKPVFGLFSYRWAGLAHATGNPVGYLKGVASQDYTAIVENTPTGDLVYAGAARPRYYGGINNRLSYRGFSLNIQINYKLGYYFRKPTINYSNITAAGTAYLAVNQDLDRRWKSPGDERYTQVPSMVYPFVQDRDFFYQYAAINVGKGDHVRLQDISLSYEFSQKAYPSLPFKGLQVFLYANNIAILWKANHWGLDPDAIPLGNDRTTMPSPPSIAFGLKGSF